MKIDRRLFNELFIVVLLSLIFSCLMNEEYKRGWRECHAYLMDGTSIDKGKEYTIEFRDHAPPISFDYPGVDNE